MRFHLIDDRKIIKIRRPLSVKYLINRLSLFIELHLEWGGLEGVEVEGELLSYLYKKCVTFLSP